MSKFILIFRMYTTIYEVVLEKLIMFCIMKHKISASEIHENIRPITPICQTGMI